MDGKEQSAAIRLAETETGVEGENESTKGASFDRLECDTLFLWLFVATLFPKCVLYIDLYLSIYL